MITIEQTEEYRSIVQKSLNQLVRDIGPIQIGSKRHFPFGWRKAAKGRTVWRILEEIINQNLEVKYKEYGLSSMQSSESEVSVYDSHIKLNGCAANIYLNVKSAVAGGRTNKDDISKAVGLRDFFREDIDRQLFICTFVIDFRDDMCLELKQCFVMPVSWLPDIYVNPSNNGNLQSSQYKNIETAIRRTNQEFITELNREIEVARQKRAAKRLR